MFESWGSDGSVADVLESHWGDDPVDDVLPKKSGSSGFDWDGLKHLGLLAGFAAGTSFLLSAWSAARHAKNKKEGMPTLGLGPFEPGLDWWAALLGLGAAFFASDYLGATGTTIALGIGLGGLCTVGVHYGSAVGEAIGTPFAGSVSGAITGALGGGEGSRPVLHQGITDLSEDADKVFQAYMGG